MLLLGGFVFRLFISNPAVSACRGTGTFISISVHASLMVTCGATLPGDICSQFLAGIHGGLKKLCPTKTLIIWANDLTCHFSFNHWIIYSPFGTRIDHITLPATSFENSDILKVAKALEYFE